MNNYTVRSSFINQVSLPQPGVVEVTMSRGVTYRYAEVPQENFELFATAVELNIAGDSISVGQEYNELIRPLPSERLH